MPKAHRNLTDGSRDLARCVPSYIVDAMDHAVRDGEHTVTLHSALSCGSPAHHTSSITRPTLCASTIARGVAVEQHSTRDDGTTWGGRVCFKILVIYLYLLSPNPSHLSRHDMTCPVSKSSHLSRRDKTFGSAREKFCRAARASYCI